VSKSCGNVHFWVSKSRSKSEVIAVT